MRTAPLLMLGLAVVTACSETSKSTVTYTNNGPVETPVTVASVVVSLTASTLQIGASAQASAVLKDASGNTVSGPSVSWSSSDAAVATVNSSGLVKAIGAGSANIVASSDGVTGSANIGVAAAPPVPVASVTVSLGSSSVAVGQTTQATAVLKDASGNLLTGRTITWSSLNTSVATVNNAGVVTAVSAGSAAIVATSEGIAGQTTINVGPVPVASVTVSLANSLGVGQTTQATAVLRDASGNVLTGRTITWSSSNTAVATVNGTGLVTAAGLGNANIIATSEASTGQATVTVVAAPPPPVASVTVSLGASSVYVGQTTQATVVLKDAGGNVLTGRTVTWTSSNTGAATVSSSGLVTAVGAGGANIVATSEGVTGQSTVTVALAPVASVSVSLGSGSLTVGQTTLATPVLKDAGGNVLTGRTVTWTSSNSAAATVNASGVVTAVGAGSESIVATSEGVTGQASVTVTLPPVASVSVSLGSSSLAVGQTTQGSVILKDASGNVLSGRTVTWTSSNSAVATVSSSGLVTAAGAGSANIVATSEGVTGQASVTVTVPVATVSVSLGSGSLTVGQTTQASAVLKDAGGNVLTGRTITWTSSNTAVATVNSSGLVAAVGAGSANIVATSGGVTGQASLTVTLAPVATVSVSLGSSALVVGQTTQATAVLKDASGNVLTGRTISWASTNPAVVTVSTTGFVSAVAAGTASVSASVDGQSGSANVAVSAPPPPSNWPNEPAGFRTLTDVNWSTLTPGGGWDNNTGTRNAAITADAAAPFSPPSVFQITFPQGFAGGSDPVKYWFDAPGGEQPTEMYYAQWIKVSNPWQGHSSGVNKIIYFNTGNTTQAVLMVMWGSNAPYSLRYELELSSASSWLNQNVATPEFTLGTWHLVEVYMKYGANSTGIFRSWFDGAKVMEYTNMNYPNNGFGEIQIAPVWGGVGDTKNETDYYWIDHIHISRP